MRIRLSRRDLDLLVWIVAFGLTTLGAMHYRYPRLSQLAVRSWVKRLRQSGWLVSAPLDERRCYYRLTHKAVQYLRGQCGVRVSRAATRPIKPNRKPEKYAWLLFTAIDPEQKRQAYRPAFDAARFPNLVADLASGKADPFRQRLFYRTDAIIGLFVLDRGQPDFVDAKLKPQVEDLWQQATFGSIVSAGQFELTVATTTVSRQRELELVISQNPPSFRWQIVVLEEIAALLFKRDAKRSMPQSKEEP